MGISIHICITLMFWQKMDLNGIFLKGHSYQDHGHSGNSIIAIGMLDFLEELKRLTQSQILMEYKI